MNYHDDDLPNSENSENSDWLDALLSQSRPQAIDDAGFSQRVMQRIGPQQLAAQARAAYARKAAKDRRLEVFTVTGAVAGMMLVALNHGWPGVAELGVTIQALASFSLPSTQGMAAYALALLSVAAVAYSMQDE